MSNVQEVFDKVIKADLYSEDYNLMCNSLAQAMIRKVISFEEYNLARGEIVKYLSGFGSLAGMLAYRELPWAFSDRLAIYLNWDNRPKF